MKLSSDLLLLLFQSLNSLEDVANLAQASRFLYHVRSQNARAIYLAVAPRSIECFLDAEALLEAQERNNSRLNFENPADLACSRMRRLVVNRRLALKACEVCGSSDNVRRWLREACSRDTCWTYADLREPRQSDTLTASERTRIIHAYYRIRTFRESPRTVLSELAVADTRELWRLWNMAEFWIRSRGMNMLTGQRGHGNADDWVRLWENIHEELCNRRKHGINRVPHMLSRMFIVIDEYQTEFVDCVPEFL